MAPARARRQPDKRRPGLGRGGRLSPVLRIGPAKSLTSFLNQGDAAEDLSTLVQLVAEGDLAVEIGWPGRWERVAEAVEALRERRVNGKAVLDVKPERA